MFLLKPSNPTSLVGIKSNTSSNQKAWTLEFGFYNSSIHQKTPLYGAVGITLNEPLTLEQQNLGSKGRTTMKNLELYMIGLIVSDMELALDFYRQLGVNVPAANGKTHIEIKMGALTFFLDSNPTRWDAAYESPTPQKPKSYTSVLEFYLETQQAVDQKYAELDQLGYQGIRAPYDTGFGMRFALICDPDGNTILLSGDLEKS
jgi:catechol 2,3-dioxygenase-like lactoylglutathione lyase family enzyme